MMAMQNGEGHMEQALWDYIDGLCCNEEQQRIASLIAEGGEWKAKYDELQQLNKSIAGSIELEHPPLRFTKNIMDTIAATHPATAPRVYINKAIIKGIAAFFILSIGMGLLYMLSNINWDIPVSGETSRLNLPHMQLENWLNATSINVIIALNVVLLLVLLDKALRARHTH